MMKVYICPECGWMRVVSRRSKVECYKCGLEQMTLAKIEFDDYVALSVEARQDYSDAWMYIHGKAKR